MTLIDTHSHIYDSAFDDDRDAAVMRAVEAGVSKILLPAIDPESEQALSDLCDKYPGVCYPMAGLHPTSVNDNPDYLRDLEHTGDILRRDHSRKIIAVGETGLDLYWSKDYFERQRDSFIRQIEWSLEYKLPLVIHTRDAWDEMVDIIGSFAGSGIRGVMHAFSGTTEDFEKISAAGDFLFGIGGVVTYKKSTIADILREIRVERIVLETDSPYLPPVPFRGKRNESAYITIIRDKVAEIYGLDPMEVARITTSNAERMFFGSTQGRTEG